MNWRKVLFYSHTFCRYFLATMILSYAFAKILGTQFTSQPSTYDQPIGTLSGFNLTWYYYGYSFWYGVFIAISQIISSLLLFFRRTTRIGIVLFLSFMINILLVDYAYNIDGAKGMATIMTLMALFIFFSEFPLFLKYFITEPPLFQNEHRPKLINKLSSIKWVYIPLVAVGLFFTLSTLKSKYMAKNQFYGTWNNSDTTAKYQYFNFEFANTFKINGNYNIEQIENGKYLFTTDSITLSTYSEEYEEFLENSTDNEVLNTDNLRMITLLKGKYSINENELIIQNDSSKFILKRKR